jgi:hypothetical protein
MNANIAEMADIRKKTPAPATGCSSINPCAQRTATSRASFTGVEVSRKATASAAAPSAIHGHRRCDGWVVCGLAAMA